MLLAALSLGASPRPSAASIDWNAVALQQSQSPLPSPGPAAAATEPPADCVCCEITRTALQNYFEGQKPMGDLQMLNFDCEAELGKVLNFHSPTAAVRWGTLPSCKCARPAGRASFPRTSPTAHSRTSTGATARRGWRRCAPTTARSTAPTSRAPSASRTRRRRRRRRRPSTRSARRWARCPWAR